jgi:hypothetical protein
MPDAPALLALDGASVVELPLPTLTLDGEPFRAGTVVVTLCTQRDGVPIHSATVWHARISDGAWSGRPVLRPRDHVHLAPFHRRTVWLVVTWAGRRVGEQRLRVSA